MAKQYFRLICRIELFLGNKLLSLNGRRWREEIGARGEEEEKEEEEEEEEEREDKKKLDEWKAH